VSYLDELAMTLAVIVVWIDVRHARAIGAAEAAAATPDRPARAVQAFVAGFDGGEVVVSSVLPSFPLAGILPFGLSRWINSLRNELQTSRWIGQFSSPSGPPSACLRVSMGTRASALR
jgi:hypothetical protein